MDFIRPTKLLWVFPKPENQANWIQNIPSKSVRHLYAQLDTILHDSNLKIAVSSLTEEAYRDWHVYYEKAMVEQKHDVIAKPEWYRDKKHALSKIWILTVLDQDGKRVGASIFSVDDLGVFTHHFKASDRVELRGPDNTSLGILLELLYLRFAFEHNPSTVTSGLSRNGFGYFNSVGYLASKLRIGYIPTAASNRPWDREFLYHDSQSLTIWFAQRDKDLVALVFPSKQKLPGEIQTYFQRQSIPCIDYPLL